MKAIILAAGKGTRLYPITLNKPKGLLEIGDETILERLIRQFNEVGISDILLVVGYKKECFMEHFGCRVRYSVYKNYASTNNLHTLWSVREELDDDVIITFADLIIQQAIVDELVQSNNNMTMVVDTSQVLEGTMRVAVSDTRLTSIATTKKEEASGNFIGISKFNKEGCRLLVNEMSKLIKNHQQDYYTIAVDQLVHNGIHVSCNDASGYMWREIDTKEEYDEVINIYEQF